MYKKIVVLIFFIIVVVSALIVLALPQQTELDKFCEPDPNFKNIYNITDEEFLALSISDTVNGKMQFKGGDYDNRSVEEIIQERVSQCDGYSAVLKACLDLYGFESGILVSDWVFLVPSGYVGDGKKHHHTYVMVKINDSWRTLDATLDNSKSSLLFISDIITFDYWTSYVVSHYLEEKKNG